MCDSSTAARFSIDLSTTGADCARLPHVDEVHQVALQVRVGFFDDPRGIQRMDAAEKRQENAPRQHPQHARQQNRKQAHPGGISKALRENPLVDDHEDEEVGDDDDGQGRQRREDIVSLMLARVFSN